MGKSTDDKNILKKSFKDKFCMVISNLFGVGYTPLMPGTASCIVAFGCKLLIPNQVWFVIFTVISIILAYTCSTRAEEIYQEKDCKKIVIDDFAGMLLTYIFIPCDFRLLIPGFFLFRMFDMFKVPPANKLEKYRGAKGIVGDDLVAGLYALILLHIARLFLKIS